MFDEYYKEREWDPVTGWPTKEKLEELSLESTVEKLAKIGRLPEH